MQSIGLPEVLVGVGTVLRTVFYGVAFVALWKFYQMFAKINENIAGIRQALQKSVLLQ